MPFALQVHFDTQFEKAIESLWGDLDAASAPSILPELGIRPHITLAVIPNLSNDQLVLLKGALPEFKASIDVRFASFGLFNGTQHTVSLTPVMNEALYGLHRQVLRYFDILGVDVNPYYQLDQWVPHCTLSKELSQDTALKTLSVCQSFSLPLSTHVTELAVVEFRPVKVLFNWSY